MPDAGEPLSPQAADLVRRIARVFLDEPADLMAELHAAVSAAADEPLRSEPALAAEVAASNRANVLHLAASMLKDPGGRVPANLTPEVLGIAREAFRRGIEQAVYTTYHAGQNAVWAYWMRTAFALSPDPAALRQALEAGSGRWPASSMTWWRRCPSSARERADLARSSHARRFEVVSLVLDNAPITTGRASTGLGYDLRRRHTAAVLWTDRAAGPGRARPGRRGPRPGDPRPAGADRDRQLLLGVGLAGRRRRYRRRRHHRGDRGPPRGPGRGRTYRRRDRRVPAQPLRRGRHPAADVPPAGPAGRQVRRCPARRARHPGRTARPRVRRPDARHAGRRRSRTARHAVRVHRRAVQRRPRRPGPVHPPQHGPQPPPARRTAAPPPARRPRPGNRRRARDRPVAGDATRQCTHDG